MPRCARAPLPAALLVIAVLGCASQQRYVPKGAPIPYQGSFSTMPTGLRVVVYETPQVDRFSVTVSYGSGSAEDPDGRQGVAHLVEHLSYRAKPAWASGLTVWDRLTGAGFRFDATTGPDATDYEVVGKPQDLRLALAVEAARMRAPLEGVSEDDLAVERDVVTAEYRERFETDPVGAQLAWVRAEAFGDHPYGRIVGGTPETVRRISLEDVRAWAKERYRPENAILVVVSPRKARDVIDVAVDAMGEIVGLDRPNVEPLRKAPAPLPPPRDEELAPATFHAPIPQPVVWVAWRVPGTLAQKDPQAEYTATALGAHFLRDAALSRTAWSEGLVDGASASYLPFAGGGLIVLRATLFRAADAPKVIELAKTAAFGARMAGRDSLAADVRDRLLVRGYLAVEDVDGSAVAAFVRATGNPDLLAGRQKQIGEQLWRTPYEYAVEHLKREQTVAAVVLPDRDAAARALALDPAPPRRDRPESADEGPGPDASAVLAAVRPPNLASVERRVLPNGLTVVLAKRGELPLAEVRLLVRTGAEGTEEIPAGLPALALASGGAEFSDRGLYLVGTGGGERLGPESVTFRTRGTSGNLDVLLESTAEWAKDRRARWFDGAHLSLVRRMRVREADVDFTARRALHGALFPDHPYGAPASADGIERLRERDADRFLSGEIRPERATLVVLSDQPPSPELWAAVERHFGGWSRGDRPRRVAAPPALPAGRRVMLVARPDASQAVVTVAVRAPPLRERDDVATEAVRWLLERRLNQRLRLETGASYGVAVSAVERERAGTLVLRAAVDRDAAAAALGDMLKALQRLASTPLDAPEVARVRWQIAREYAFRFDRLGDAAEALVVAAQHDLPPDHWDRTVASIAELTPERLQKAAAALAIGREIVVVVGDAAALRPALERAGLAVEMAR